MRSIGEFLVSLAALIVVAILAGLVALGVAADLGWIQEDDALWNCRIMGNWECGPDAPWHGFVNNFKHL